jgi:hypothetical protein
VSWGNARPKVRFSKRLFCAESLRTADTNRRLPGLVKIPRREAMPSGAGEGSVKRDHKKEKARAEAGLLKVVPLGPAASAGSVTGAKTGRNRRSQRHPPVPQPCADVKGTKVLLYQKGVFSIVSVGQRRPPQHTTAFHGAGSAHCCA